MTTEFPTLADVIAKHADTWVGQCSCGAGYRFCTCGWRDHGRTAQFSRASFAAHVQDEWRKACTVETVEQLDALPHGALVVREYTSMAGWRLNEVWGRGDESWYCLAAPLIPPGNSYGLPNLPAYVVYVPNDGAA